MTTNKETSIDSSQSIQKQQKSQNQHPHYSKKSNIEEIPKLQQMKENCDDDQQTQMLSYLNQKYFNCINEKSKSKAHTLNNIAQKTLLSQLNVGTISISSRTKNISDMIDLGHKEQINSEKLKKKAIQIQLQYLQAQINDARKNRSKSKQNDSHKNLLNIDVSTAVLSKTMHSQFLKKLQRQKKQLMQKRKKMQQVQRQKEEEFLKNQKIKEQEKIMKEKQARHQRAVQSLQKHKQIKQSRIKKKQETDKAFEQMKQKKHLYQVLQQKYNDEVAMPLLEQKKKKLKQMRDYSKSFKVQELIQHQKQYLRKRQDALNVSNARLQESTLQSHYLKPQKPQKLAKLLEEQDLYTKLKLQQKKRKLQQKISRQEQFAAYLKRRSPPKVDPKLAQEIQKRIASQQRQRKQRDGKSLGQNYLQEVKRMKKKTVNSQMKINQTDTFIKKEQQQHKKNTTNYLTSNTKTKQDYDQLRQKRIQRLINSQNDDRDAKLQKIKLLKIQAQKLSEQQKRKQQIIKVNGKHGKNRTQQDGQSMNLLMTSIKAKMGIIDIYNQS